MKRFLFALAGVGLLVGLSDLGARPGEVEADPNRDYTVGPDAGSWMIMAASFSDGRRAPDSKAPKAADLAHALALQIRREYKLPAWVFNHGGEERAAQEKRIAEIRSEFLKETSSMGKVGPRIRRYRIDEQFAVLIGGYKDMETARKELDRIKKLPAPSYQFCNLVHVERQKPDDSPSTINNKALENPFERSFVVPNPAAPKEQKVQDENGWDPVIKKLNADEPLSLLRCRKRYTLVIKDFQGTGVLLGNETKKSSFLDKLLGRGSVDALNASALQARAFAQALRSMKEMPLETWVLHTKYATFVTVGSFDSLDDPRMTEAKMQLSKLMMFAGPEGPMKMWAQPLPMEVPHF